MVGEDGIVGQRQVAILDGFIETVSLSDHQIPARVISEDLLIEVPLIFIFDQSAGLALSINGDIFDEGMHPAIRGAIAGRCPGLCRQGGQIGISILVEVDSRQERC